jgi:hypothetical protein
MAVVLSADCPPPALLVLERSIRRPHHLEVWLLGFILGRGATVRHGYALTPCATRESE